MNSSAQADAFFWMRIHSPDLSERLMKEVYCLRPPSTSRKSHRAFEFFEPLRRQTAAGRLIVTVAEMPFAFARVE